VVNPAGLTSTWRPGQPVISVDTKKGSWSATSPGVAAARTARAGLRPMTSPVPRLQGNAYGVYDLGANTGSVSVRTDRDPASVAVAPLRWREQVGRARQLRVCLAAADAFAGGSNVYPVRLWTNELVRLQTRRGLPVRVC
jgi:hypothetical protein